MRKQIKDISSYFIVAGISVGVNLTSRLVYDLFMSFMLSVALSYFTGMISNFTLSKLFLFGARGSGNIKNEFVRFFLVTCIALSITLLFSWLSFKMLHTGNFGAFEEARVLVGNILGKVPTEETTFETISHVIGIGFGFFGNFFGHKYYSFKSVPT